MGLSSCTYRIQKTPYPQNCRVNLTLRYKLTHQQQKCWHSSLFGLYYPWKTS
jgi:hypothetical protein